MERCRLYHQLHISTRQEHHPCFVQIEFRILSENQQKILYK